MQLRSLFPSLGSPLRHRSRLVSVLTASTSAALIGAPLAAAFSQAPGAGTEVHIEVTGLRSTKGLVRACMTAREDKFPHCENDAEAHTLTVPAAAEVTFDFGHVANGLYAIALLHDENSNGKVDKALLLIPKEGFGFSRDAPVRMGPPSFRDAAFEVGSAPVRQTIRMRYLL